MAIRISSGMRTALAGTAGIKDILEGGVMDIYTGSQPTSADYVETGTKLVRLSSTSGSAVADGLKFGAAAAGVLGRTSPAWTGPVLVSGVAGWARFYGTTGTSGTSSTTWRFDMSVGVAGADLNLSHTDLVLDSVLSISTFNITEPAE
jgi:hypothetical protein